MRTYYIIGAIVIVLAAAGGGYYLWKNGSMPAETQQPAGPQAVATSTYATSTFSAVYPVDFSVNDAYTYDQFPKKPIYGVKFTIPATSATGTNLSGYDTGVSVEQLPRAKNCTADIYIPANVTPQLLSDNGVEYSVASTSDAGAGNFYEEQVYALSGSNPCTAVRYFIHSTNIDNYPPGVVHAYDRAALMTAFDTIRRSVVLKQ